jgi:predicted phage terminase large subunit-like protein
MSDEEVEALRYAWEVWARPDQLPPPEPWRTWLVLGGRGSGKSRTGGELVKRWTSGPGAVKVALVAPTYGDARKIFIDGESGINAIYPQKSRPRWVANKGEIQWPNGSIGWVYTCEEPERFRNPQHHYCWWDESAASPNVLACWSLLSATMRLGANPQVLLTSTPKPHKFFRDLLLDPSTVHTTMSTAQNKANLSAGFFEILNGLYGNTGFAAQELEGVLLAESDGALFKSAWFKRLTGPLPQIKKTIVAVDPSSSDSKSACECGIIVAALGVDNRVYLLEDASKRCTPAEWIRLTDQLRTKYKAQEIVYEANYGKGFIESLYRSEAPQSAPYLKTVQATTSKSARATPVAALVEGGRVVWTKPTPALEDQMTTWVPGQGKSPDRLDAMVWAVYCLIVRAVPYTYNGA